jgi:hypothetical protein
MFTGALHIHSTYSDGEFKLAELREIFLAANCSFVCMTDHAEYFDGQSIQRYVAECESLSDSKFRMVPGLEYRCDRNMHILGYHATKLFAGTDPQEVIRHIKAQGAVSVIAHPRDDSFQWIEGFATLPQGIEAWNSKYDGRYAPRSATFGLVQRLQQRVPDIHAFYGLDLHWKRQFREFYIAAEAEALNGKAITTALVAGKYVGLKEGLRLPASGVLPAALLERFDRSYAHSKRMWRIMKLGNTLLQSTGIRIPASLKAQLRRIF